MPFENPTTYIAGVNTNIATTSTRVTVDPITWQENSYLFKAKPASVFNGDFTIDIDAKAIDGGDQNGEGIFWAIANQIGTWQDLIDSSEDALRCVFYEGAANDLKVYLGELDGGTVYQDGSVSLSWDTMYYLRIRRDESVGTYGTVYCDIYPTDADRAAETNVIDSLLVTLHTSKKDFNLLYMAMAHDTDGVAGRDFYGFWENLDINNTAEISYPVRDTFALSTTANLETRIAEKGTAWQKLWGAETAQCNIGVVRLLKSSAGADYYCYGQLITPPSADYTVEASLLKITDVARDYGVAGRISNTAETFYYTYWNGGGGASGTWYLFKMVAGTPTQLDSVAGTFNLGDYKRIQLIMNGTSIAVKVNGTEILTATDGAITDAGFAGVYASGSGADTTSAGFHTKWFRAYASLDAGSGTTHYIDPDQSTNGDGTSETPWNTWEGIDFQIGHRYLQNKGTTAPIGPLLLDVDGSPGNEIVFGAYGSGANPIIDVNYRAEQTFFMLDCTYIEISDFDVKNTISHNFYIEGKSNNMTVDSVRAYNAGMTDNFWANFFIRGTRATSGKGGTYTLADRANNIILTSCVGTDAAGMNFHILHAYAMRLYDCVSADAGQLLSSGAHGMTSIPLRLNQDKFNWVLYSGSIYRADITGIMRDVTHIEISAANTYLTLNEGNYATLGNNEFDVEGAYVYVNVGGGAPAGHTLYDSLMAADIGYIDCESYGTLGGPGEGIGIAFDDLTNNSYCLRCYSHDNTGPSYTVNKGFNNKHVYSIADSDTYGIFYNGISGNNELVNCVIYNGTDGIRARKMNGHTVIARNTIFKDNIDAWDDDATGTKDSNYNCYHGNSVLGVTTGANDITDDPRFDDAINGDFHIASDSACVDAGVSVAGIHDTSPFNENDYYGNSISGPYDIGLHEVSSGGIFPGLFNQSVLAGV